MVLTNFHAGGIHIFMKLTTFHDFCILLWKSCCLFSLKWQNFVIIVYHHNLPIHTCIPVSQFQLAWGDCLDSLCWSKDSHGRMETLLLLNSYVKTDYQICIPGYNLSTACFDSICVFFVIRARSWYCNRNLHIESNLHIRVRDSPFVCCSSTERMWQLLRRWFGRTEYFLFLMQKWGLNAELRAKCRISKIWIS